MGNRCTLHGVGRSRALLKSIVMVGASLTSGCSGTVLDRTGDGDRRGDGGEGSVDAGGTTGGTGSIETGGASTMTSGGAGGAAPVDCGAPQRLYCVCTSVTQVTLCVPETQGGQTISCACNPQAPLTPEDCPSTQQFSCVSWSPPGTSCSCDPGRPRDQADCMSGYCFTCHSYDPPVGCECVNCLVIR